MTRECLAVPDTHVPVTFVSFNAHYGRAIADPNILAPDEYGDLPYVMAQEIWPNAAKKSSRIVHDREDFREKQKPLDSTHAFRRVRLTWHLQCRKIAANQGMWPSTF